MFLISCHYAGQNQAYNLYFVSGWWFEGKIGKRVHFMWENVKKYFWTVQMVQLKHQRATTFMKWQKGSFCGTERSKITFGGQKKASCSHICEECLNGLLFSTKHQKCLFFALIAWLFGYKWKQMYICWQWQPRFCHRQLNVYLLAGRVNKKNVLSQSSCAHSFFFAHPFVWKWQIHFFFYFFCQKLAILLQIWKIKMQVIATRSIWKQLSLVQTPQASSQSSFPCYTTNCTRQQWS